jgi:hypothetical protein
MNAAPVVTLVDSVRSSSVDLDRDAQVDPVDDDAEREGSMTGVCSRDADHVSRPSGATVMVSLTLPSGLVSGGEEGFGPAAGLWVTPVTPKVATPASARAAASRGMPATSAAAGS